MNNNIIIGNIFALITGICIAISIFHNNKKEILKIQIFAPFVALISCLFLNGLSGVLVNSIALFRNVISYLDKSNNTIRKILVAFLIIFGIYFNNKGFIGFFPILASVEYSIVLLDKKTTSQQLKISLVINLILWLIYDLYILAITSALIYFVIIIILLKNINKNKMHKNIHIA